MLWLPKGQQKQLKRWKTIMNRSLMFLKENCADPSTRIMVEDCMFPETHPAVTRTVYRKGFSVPL